MPSSACKKKCGAVLGGSVSTPPLSSFVGPGALPPPPHHRLSTDAPHASPATPRHPFSALRAPPRSPPFPYTTLFRSIELAHHRVAVQDPRQACVRGHVRLHEQHVLRRIEPARSEEHTSELQSRFELVCRLLLAKKNAARSSGGASPLRPCRRSSVPAPSHHHHTTASPPTRHTPPLPPLAIPFPRYAPPRDLHPFPTRRSSDLLSSPIIA